MLKKKLLVILPRGESIKNFVYSGITDKLREEYQIIFFSIVPNSTIKDYLISKCDVFHELEEDVQNSLFSDEIKKVLQIAHGKKLNSVTGNLKILKDDVSSKKNLKSTILRKLRKAIALLFSSHDRLIWLTDFFIQSNYQNKHVRYYESLLEKLKPDLVFNTSHIHNLLSLPLMYAVKKMHIKSAAFLFSWDNLTSQGRIIPTYDYLFTWNEKIKQDLLRFYPNFNKANVFVTGTPQFDFHFDKNYIDAKEDLYNFLGIEAHKKIILYSTGMSYYTPKEYKHVIEIEKVLQNIDSDLVLVVRIYSKDDNAAYYKLRETHKSIIIPDHYWELNHLTPTLKDVKLFNSLLNHCTIGINVASTVSLELAILNKPIINIGYNPPGEDVYPNDYKKIYEFDHYKPIVESGAVSVVDSLASLENEIQNYLNNTSFKAAERKKLIKNFFGDDLHSSKIVVFQNVFNTIFENA